MRTQSALVAAAAAALFLTGFAASAQAEEHGTGAKIKCEGVNSCKGHADCKTAKNACKGQNGCGGQGFMMMTPAECEAAKAEAAEKK